MPVNVLKYSRSKLLDIKLNGKPTYVIKNIPANTTFTREFIKDKVQEISNRMAKTHGSKAGGIGCALLYKGYKWRGGYMNNFGENVKLHDFYDGEGEEDEIIGFKIYYSVGEIERDTIKKVYKKRNKEPILNNTKTVKKTIKKKVKNTDDDNDEIYDMGANENNDCLYDCIDKYFNKNPFKSPEKLKEFLKLNRKDFIPFDKIPEIENTIKYNINIISDEKIKNKDEILYTSNNKYLLNMKLKYIKKDKHVIINDDYIRIERTSIKERQPIIYDRIDKDNVLCYDGKSEHIMSYENFKEDSGNCLSSHYIYINLDKKLKLSLKETYDEFILKADSIKSFTNNKMNFYKCGTDTQAAKSLFYNFNKYVMPDPIKDFDEELFIHSCSGPMIFAINNDREEGEEYIYKGPCYKYDLCSSYMSIMADPHMKFPIKEGELLNIDEDELYLINDKNEKYVRFGIYRCNIDIENKKLIKENDKGFYTHYDLNRAIKLNYEITLYDRVDEPNFLYYSNDKLVQGHNLFGETIDFLFKLKKSGIPGAKQIGNCLWGSLCHADILPALEYDDKIKKPVEVYKTSYVNRIYNKDGIENDDIYIIEILKKGLIYKDSEYARMKPFILAKGRDKITKYFFNDNDIRTNNIIRTHTDSIFCKEKLNVKTGDGLGMLRYEGYCKEAIIKNCNIVQGKFII